MKNTFLEWLKEPYEQREFKVIEYCTGDFGDKGRIIDYILAEDAEHAKYKYKLLHNIKDNEICYYDFV